MLQLFLAVLLALLPVSSQAATTWKPITFNVPATACPTGYIPVPQYTLPSGTIVPAFCVMRYEAQNDGNAIATSANGAAPMVNLTWQNAAGSCAARGDGSVLITENQWLSIAHQVTSVATNWSSGTMGSGYLWSGHNDNTPPSALAAPSSPTADCYTGTGNAAGSNQCRALTLPNGEIIWDFAGNVWEWVGQLIPKASRYYGGANGWMAYSSADGVSTIASLPIDKMPKNGWNANQGMGRYYDGASTAGGYNSISEWPSSCTSYCDSYAAFVRGGYWGNAASAGVFALILDYGRSVVDSGIGFRCTR